MLRDCEACTPHVVVVRPRGPNADVGRPRVVVAGSPRWQLRPREPKRIGRVVIPQSAGVVGVGQERGILVERTGRVVVAGRGRVPGRIFFGDWKHEPMYSTVRLTVPIAGFATYDVGRRRIRDTRPRSAPDVRKPWSRR